MALYTLNQAQSQSSHFDSSRASSRYGALLCPAMGSADRSSLVSVQIYQRPYFSYG